MNNELIERLVENTVLGVVSDNSENKSITVSTPSEEFIVKYTELLVKECAEICLEANDHKNILRHFGIE